MRRCLLRLILAITLLSVLTACFPRNKPLEPRLTYVPNRGDYRGLPTLFEPLSTADKKQEWGREYALGVQFANDLDLYRAVTSFKRSLFLLPRGQGEREGELYTYIATCYFIGERYEEVIETIVESPLIYASNDYPAYGDLLTMLYTAYSQTGNCDQAAIIDRQLRAIDEGRAEKTELANLIIQGRVDCLANYSETQDLVDTYCRCKKSPQKAQALSAVIPGAGFLYVGQKQSAFTAFLLNALFIAAAWQFFDRGYIAAGIFTTSLELGWYTGAIYGSGEAAHKYNERLYERLAEPILRHRRLYPSLLIRWRF